MFVPDEFRYILSRPGDRKTTTIFCNSKKQDTETPFRGGRSKSGPCCSQMPSCFPTVFPLFLFLIIKPVIWEKSGNSFYLFFGSSQPLDSLRARIRAVEEWMRIISSIKAGAPARRSTSSAQRTLWQLSVPLPTQVPLGCNYTVTFWVEYNETEHQRAHPVFKGVLTLKMSTTPEKEPLTTQSGAFVWLINLDVSSLFFPVRM